MPTFKGLLDDTQMWQVALLVANAINFRTPLKTAGSRTASGRCGSRNAVGDAKRLRFKEVTGGPGDERRNLCFPLACRSCVDDG